MKLMLVINNEFSAFHLRGAVKHFASKGWEVVIMSTPGPLVDALAEEEGGRVIPISLDRGINPLADIRSLFQLIPILKRERPDVINVGSPKTGFLFALAKMWMPKLPLIFTLRGIRSDTLSGVKGKLVRYTETLACKKADEVIVISPSLKEHALNIGMVEEEKTHVLGEGSSNGVDTQRFESTSQWEQEGARLKERFNIDDSAFVISCVGRVTKDKGIEEVFKAYRDLKAENENIHWLVAGPIEEDDPVDDTIMKSMQEDPNIYLLGSMDPIQPVYAASDVLVLYSHREGFGNVVLQASSMEVPVVVADIPGLRDTTANDVTGFVVEGHSPSQLAAALRIYRQSPLLRAKHGAQGRDRAMRSFAQEVIWKGQEELYKRFLA